MTELQTAPAFPQAPEDPTPVAGAPAPAATEWSDPRLGKAKWPGVAEWQRVDRKLLVLFPLAVLASLWYFNWLLRPERVGDPVLYGLLVTAELFNLVQAAGFWWTCRRGRDRGPAPIMAERPEIDILIPIYTEPLEVVAPTVAAAVAMRGANLHVFVLDDAGRPELRALAERHGAT